MKLFIDVYFKIFELEKFNSINSLLLHEKQKLLVEKLKQSYYDEEIIKNITIDCSSNEFDFYKNEKFKAIHSYNDKELLLNIINFSQIKPLDNYYFINPNIYFSKENIDDFPDTFLIKRYYRGELDLSIDCDFFYSDENNEIYLLSDNLSDFFINEIKEYVTNLKNKCLELNENNQFVFSILNSIDKNHKVLIGQLL